MVSHGAKLCLCLGWPVIGAGSQLDRPIAFNFETPAALSCPHTTENYGYQHQNKNMHDSNLSGNLLNNFGKVFLLNLSHFDFLLV